MRAAAALAPIIVVLLGFVGFCLLDLKRTERVRWLPKWGWAILCVMSIPLGGLLYLTLAKPSNGEA